MSILETSPVGRSAPVRDVVFPHIGIANRHLFSAVDSFSFEAGKRRFWQDWKHDSGFCSDYVSLPTQFNQSFLFPETASVQIRPQVIHIFMRKNPERYRPAGLLSSSWTTTVRRYDSN